MKRIIYKKKYYIYQLYQNHSDKWDDLYKSIVNKREKIKLLDDYSSYEFKCFKYLNRIEYYNKKEIEMKLRDIYNNNKFSFLLKNNTI